MSKYKYLHEVESVVLRSQSPRCLKEVCDVLSLLGFQLRDGVFSLDRRDNHPLWQHSSIIEVDILHAGCEVLEIEDSKWDELRFNYLFAFLPFELSYQFVETVCLICEKVQLDPLYGGAVVGKSQLLDIFNKIKLELFSETGEVPGSEKLVIYINSTYPRL